MTAYRGRRRWPGATPDQAETDDTVLELAGPANGRLRRPVALGLALLAVVTAVALGGYLAARIGGSPSGPLAEPTVAWPTDLPTPPVAGLTPSGSLSASGPGGASASPNASGSGRSAAPGAPGGTPVVPAARPSASQPAALVVDNFNTVANWSGNLNDLGRWTGAEQFTNGGGQGVVTGGALTLAYNDDGWFGSDVLSDVSGYRYLVLRLAGATGGEEQQVKLKLGGVNLKLASFVLDGGGHPTVQTSYQDIRIPLAANGIDAKRPGDVELSFWYGGTSSLLIDEIRFE